MDVTMWRLAPLFAVVEIGAEPALLALAVFVITFVAVCAFFWLLRGFRQGGSGPPGATLWQFNMTRQLDVRKPAFDRLVDFTGKAAARPAVTPETRDFDEKLGRARKMLARFSRMALIVIGVCGIGASIALFRQDDSANMLALPAGIILLLSLGALLSGLVPSRTVDPGEPLNPELFKNIYAKISMQPLTINLSQLDLVKASEMLRHGSSADEVARAIYPAYDALNDFEKRAVQQALTSLRL